MIALEYEMTYTETIEGPLGPTAGSPLGDRVCWEVTTATLSGARINANMVGTGTDWIRLGIDGIRRPDLRAQLVTDDGELILLRYDLAVIRSSDRFLAALAAGCKRAHHEHMHLICVVDLTSSTEAEARGAAFRSIEAAFVPQGSAHIVAVETREARSRSLLIDPDDGSEQAIMAAEGTLLPLGPAADGNWLGRLYGARQPETLLRFALDGRRALILGDIADPWAGSTLGPGDLASAEDVRWRSIDGLEIQGWLYRPKGKSRGLIVQVHGGPTAHSG